MQKCHIYMAIYLHLNLVDLKSIYMLLNWPKYCARRMKKISISRSNAFSTAFLKLTIFLKLMNIFTQNLVSIWQKAICTRPYNFSLSNIHWIFIFCIFYIGFRFFLDTPRKQSWIRSANFEKEVENHPLAYTTHGILKPNRGNWDFDSNQLNLYGTTFPDL